MSGLEEEDRVGKFPEEGRVKNVRSQWRVYEDGVLASQMQDEEFQQKFVLFGDEAMAHNMQMEEFDHKYGMNRYHRRTVRDDIPVAKICQSEEEERKQKEEMNRLERQKRIADEDERIALSMQEQLRMQEDNDRLQRRLADEERTRRLLEGEQETILQDEELARQLQEKEKAKFEKKRLERERRKLENQIANERLEAERVLSQYRKETQPAYRDNARNVSRETRQQNGSEPEKLLRVDGKVEDIGDFSDFYNLPEDMHEEDRQKLQQIQDEELAALLQEQEQKRGAQLKMDTLKAIEAQDAELAHIMQEQEKLREKKRKQKRQERKSAEQQQRQQSLEHQHLASRQHSHASSTEPRERYSSQHSLDPDEAEYVNAGSIQPPLNGNHHPSMDPRDEDLYEQPWTSIPRMVAPLPPPPPPSHPTQTHPQYYNTHERLMRSNYDEPPPQGHQAQGHYHGRQSSRTSQDSYTGSRDSLHSNTTPQSTSPGNNLFANLDPTVSYGRSHDRGNSHDRTRSHDPPRSPDRSSPIPVPDVQLPVQRSGSNSAEQHSPNEDAYAEVGDFAPVPGQKRNTLKKGKEKKASGSGNNKGSCKQQ